MRSNLHETANRSFDSLGACQRVKDMVRFCSRAAAKVHNECNSFNFDLLHGLQPLDEGAVQALFCRLGSNRSAREWPTRSGNSLPHCISLDHVSSIISTSVDCIPLLECLHRSQHLSQELTGTPHALPTSIHPRFTTFLHVL